MTQGELAEMYFDFLTTEGFNPEMEEGFIRFRTDEGVFLVVVDAEDEEYFRLIFPNFWPIENGAERLQVLAACDAATGETKVAKIFTVRDNVWGTIELFLERSEYFRGVFQRCMRALNVAVATFVEKMRE